MKLLLAAVLAVVPVHHDEVRRPTHCPQYAPMVAYVGFTAAEQRVALRVMHRESRCFHQVVNSTDPNGGSIGLMQINMFWCKPSKWQPKGWLQAQGILEDCDDLFVPLTNLYAAKAIYDYSADRNGNGWQPWGL